MKRIHVRARQAGMRVKPWDTGPNWARIQREGCTAKGGVRWSKGVEIWEGAPGSNCPCRILSQQVRWRKPPRSSLVGLREDSTEIRPSQSRDVR